MRTSEEIDKIAAALVKFQGEVESPKKSVENDAFKKGGKALKYADLDAIIKTVTPALAKNGLSQHQFTDTDIENKAVKITTMILHESGQYFFGDTLVLPAESFGKFNAQTVGSAITYGRRYSLSAILGIASENDDDANSISGQDKGKQEKQYVKPSAPVEPPMTKEQYAELKELVVAYCTAKGMMTNEAFNETMQLAYTHAGARDINHATAKQAESAINYMDKLLRASKPKNTADPEQVGMEMQYNIPEK